MIIHECKQGSPDWHQLRLGIPTGSQFGRIVTAVKGDLSTARHKLMAELIAERFLGEPLEKFTSAAMERGSGMEEEAVAFYECQRRLDSVKVGFITNDEKTWGVSPDRFLGDAELLEVKCPDPDTHVSYLLATIDTTKQKSVAQEYRPQVQGQLWVTGRQKCVTLSYCPGFPPAILEVERDEKYIELLAQGVALFSRDLERLWAQLYEQYPAYRKGKKPTVDSAFGISEFINDADVAWAMSHAAKVEAARQ